MRLLTDHEEGDWMPGRIVALEAEVARLREALMPFARWAANMYRPDLVPGNMALAIVGYDDDRPVKVAHLRAAQTALAAAPGPQEPCCNPECPIGCPDSHADIYAPDFRCGTFAPRDAEVEICGQACPFPTLYQGVTQYGLCFKQKGHDGAHETRVAHASVKWIGSTYLRRHAGPQEPPITTAYEAAEDGEVGRG